MLRNSGDLKDFINKAIRSRMTYFLVCYLAVGIVNLGLLYFLWPGDNSITWLAFGWPFFLADILTELLSAEVVKEQVFIVPVHKRVFYGLMLLAAIGLDGYIVARGIKAEKRRRGVWVVLLGLLAPANLTYFILMIL